MIKNLVIVESPAKAKTIEKFLGPDYKVMSSYGHIRDLKKKSFSIDVEGNFKPVYEIPEDKKTLVSELRKAAKNAEMVWLASDEDREGEAIAWHLYEVLNLKPDNTRRIVFHEITKDAILNAIANPRGIDLARVDAQQARRVLDRIVGFELSPVLWKKIKPALSAGRVQSVAVRLIVEREAEIKAFVPEQYYRVNGIFDTDSGVPVKADLKERLTGEDQARRLLEKCAGAAFEVTNVSVRPLTKSPAPPFTTSTLQQEASRKLGMSVSQTMMVAQQLYEAGHITYMRTDSLNLSQLAINAISDAITHDLGKEYLKVRQYHATSKGAQEAHEAIRPTYINKRTIEGSDREKRLYDLIWKRTVASQMADAEIEKTIVDISASTLDGDAQFVASGEVIKRDGFLRVYIESRDDEHAMDAPEGTLPALAVGQQLRPQSIAAHEQYTRQPARYSEATLVKKMEELGIGRPSTYAPTISTIQQRDYVVKGEGGGTERTLDILTLQPDGSIVKSTKTETVGSEKGRLIPTDIGTIVNTFLEEYFPEIVDYNFTARVEERFDDIANGQLEWPEEIKSFYYRFHPAVDSALNMRLEHKVGERELGTDPTTGKPVFVKIGRYGPMVQIGTNDDEEKPQFASLLKDQSVADITLEEALKLFEFPRRLGDFEDKAVTVAIGRFGPYVRHDKLFVSIPKEMSPAAVTLDEAIELIKAKREANAKREIKVFPEEPELSILNGRWGPYIVYKKANYKLPKDIKNPADLTLQECMDIVAQQDAKPKRTTRKKA